MSFTDVLNQIDHGYEIKVDPEDRTDEYETAVQERQERYEQARALREQAILSAVQAQRGLSIHVVEKKSSVARLVDEFEEGAAS